MSVDAVYIIKEHIPMAKSTGGSNRLSEMGGGNDGEVLLYSMSTGPSREG